MFGIHIDNYAPFRTANANAMCTIWTLNSQNFHAMTPRLVQNIQRNFNVELVELLENETCGKYADTTTASLL